MKKLHYTLRLKGLSTPSGTISLKALKEVCDLLSEVSERGLRLAVEGDSVKPGRTPAWLTKSLDMTITGLKKGSTILDIEAPVLGESAKREIQQQNFLYATPAPEDTALTLLCGSVRDTTAENLDSDTYDAGVLNSLLGFKTLLKGAAPSIELRCNDRKGETFKLNAREFEKIQRLRSKTPEPRALVISGLFNLIEHSKRTFHLTLSDKDTLLGTIDSKFLDVEQMRTFWGKKVTIKGTVHFRPSGKVRLIEAQVIKPMEAGEEIFEQMPSEQMEAGFLKEIKQKASDHGAWLKDIWGKWPSDESIDEILAALKVD